MLLIYIYIYTMPWDGRTPHNSDQSSSTTTTVSVTCGKIEQSQACDQATLSSLCRIFNVKHILMVPYDLITLRLVHLIHIQFLESSLPAKEIVDYNGGIYLRYCESQKLYCLWKNYRGLRNKKKSYNITHMTNGRIRLHKWAYSKRSMLSWARCHYLCNYSHCQRGEGDWSSTVHVLVSHC